MEFALPAVFLSYNLGQLCANYYCTCLLNIDICQVLIPPASRGSYSLIVALIYSTVLLML